MKLTIEVSDEDVAQIKHFLDITDSKTSEFSSHGQLDLAKLTVMLLQDVALVVRRPGSWEGANMMTVLGAHGYHWD